MESSFALFPTWSRIDIKARPHRDPNCRDSTATGLQRPDAGNVKHGSDATGGSTLAHAEYLSPEPGRVRIASLPTAALDYLVAAQYRESVSEASGLVLLSTIGSAITLPVFIIWSLHRWPIG